MTIPQRFVLRGLAIACVCATPWGADAQTSAVSPAAQVAPATPHTLASPAPAAGAAEVPSLESQGFTFDPAGRRDPFVSLMRRGEDVHKSPIGPRPGGLSGLETSEVTLKGTVATQGSWVGILLGVDRKTYIVRPGDRLLDGTIQSITQDSLVVAQHVNDPLSLDKQREVRKALKQTEEGK